MKALLLQLRQSTFLRHNTIFFIGTITVAFLNYLYHPILSRMLDLQDFGEVQTIFSLSVQMGIILGVLGMVTLNIVANKEHDPGRESLLGDIQSISLLAMLVVCGLLLVGSPWLARLFHFNSVVPFFILVVLLITSLPVTFRRAYLQASHDFVGVSISNILVSGGRLVAAIALVLFGLGTLGATGALVIAQLLSLFYLYIKTKEARSLGITLRPKLSPLLIKELGYILLTLLSVGFISFLTSADVLFAKSYFDPALAGAYSGISTVARIIFFATGSISAVLLPSIKISHTFKEHSAIFFRSLVLLLSVGLGALVLFILFPAFVINLLIGQKFLSQAYLLPRLSLITFIASLTNLGFYYFLALREYKLIFIALLGTLATIVPIAMHHGAPIDIVNGFMFGSVVTFLLLSILFMYVWYRSRDEGNIQSIYNTSV